MRAKDTVRALWTRGPCHVALVVVPHCVIERVGRTMGALQGVVLRRGCCVLSFGIHAVLVVRGCLLVR